MSKWSWFLHQLKLPSDVVLELPRITVIGHIHVYIENHQGLMTFSSSELKLKTKQGFIYIKGSSFVLKMMLPEEILLEGVIEDIKIIDQT